MLLPTSVAISSEECLNFISKFVMADFRSLFTLEKLVAKVNYSKFEKFGVVLSL